jgi:hypothetical protein
VLPALIAIVKMSFTLMHLYILCYEFFGAVIKKIQISQDFSGSGQLTDQTDFLTN